MIHDLIIALATWRVTSLIIYEDGPGDIFVKLRTFIIGQPRLRPISGAILCFWCASVWIAAALSVLCYAITDKSFIIHSLAISALAIFFDEVMNAARKDT